LGEGRLDGEGGAEIAVECAGEVTGGDAVFGDDVGLQIGQVEREVLGQIFVAEDVAQQTGVVRVHHDVMVGQAGIAILTLGPEVDDEEGHGVALALDAPVAVAGPLVGGDKVEVSPGCVGIGDDGVGLVHRAVPEAEAVGAALLDEDAIDFGVEVSSDAKLLQEAVEGVDDGAGAADGAVDAPFPLQVMDENIDTGGGACC